jgi:hypothetical protein
MRVTAVASLYALLLTRVAGWKKGDPCPTEIRVTIPNADTRNAMQNGMSRFAYWSHNPLSFGYYGSNGNGNGGEDDEPRQISFATVAQVHDALVTCPNIKVLDLRTALLGCTEFPDRSNFPFDIAGGEKYPALEELSLEGYRFGEREWDLVQPRQTFQLPGGLAVPNEVPDQKSLQGGEGSAGREEEGFYNSWLWHWEDWFTSGKARRYLAWRRIPQEQRLKTNLELWLDAMDFSKIHTLSIKDIQRHADTALVTKLPSMLTSLRSLSLVGSWQNDESATDRSDPWPAREFILNVAPEASLTHLSWTESGTTDEEVFTSVLKRHGSSLTSLEWRTSETWMPRRPMLSSKQIRELPTLAPKLQTLSLAMNRKHGGWPGELMLLASSLPHLSNLTVYFEFQSECRIELTKWTEHFKGPMPKCDGNEQVARPYLKKSSARDLFRKMRLARKPDDEELTTVTFREGDWTRAYDGPLTIGENWLEGLRVWVECSVLAEDGSRKAEGDQICTGAFENDMAIEDEQDNDYLGSA